MRLCYADIYEFGKVEVLVRRLIEEMKSIVAYYKTIDSIESSASSRNRSSDGMEVDKPYVKVVMPLIVRKKMMFRNALKLNISWLYKSSLLQEESWNWIITLKMILLRM